VRNLSSLPSLPSSVLPPDRLSLRHPELPNCRLHGEYLELKRLSSNFLDQSDKVVSLHLEEHLEELLRRSTSLSEATPEVLPFNLKSSEVELSTPLAPSIPGELLFPLSLLLPFNNSSLSSNNTNINKWLLNPLSFNTVSLPPSTSSVNFSNSINKLNLLPSLLNTLVNSPVPTFSVVLLLSLLLLTSILVNSFTVLPLNLNPKLLLLGSVNNNSKCLSNSNNNNNNNLGRT
jgi:hypothetical protein